ncbi:MAG TPA: DUF1343 domain-containing protein [Acidimicrobiales bacterium]|nr:DUF1343 domain-containing protein [Acidimicrobiales bacterium]
MTSPRIRTGIDRLLAGEAGPLGRIAWLANGAAVTTGDLVWGPRAGLAAGLQVTQLLAPEHGPHSAVKEGARIASGTDPVTGLPVRSLYADPSADDDPLGEALATTDTVLLDLVDNHARYSTYPATSVTVLERAAQAGVRVVVLDRANELGRRREGPGLSPGVRSLVGRIDVPIRHGLTLGEMLRWHVRTTGLGVELDVLAVEGWDDLDRPVAPVPYLPSSPNINGLEAQLLYSGTCLIEGTNLSEGRGTANPFQMVGAPWVRAEELVDALRAQHLPGVAWRAVRFVPLASKHAGEVCAGVFAHVVDPPSVRPVQLGVTLLEAVFGLHEEAEILPAAAERPRFLDLLWGSSRLGDHLAGLGPTRPGDRFTVETFDGFDEAVRPDLLYPAAA